MDFFAVSRFNGATSRLPIRSERILTEKLHALDLPPLPRQELPPEMQAYFAKCEERLGLLPNVLQCYSFDADKLQAFTQFYNNIMLAPSGLSKLEREMIATVVASIQHCVYCVTAHGAAVRALSGDPALGEILAINYRQLELPVRHRAMLDFAAILTERPDHIGAPERALLRAAGWSDRDIWDIAATAALFNMTTRLASAIDMQPNAAYHAMARAPSPAGGNGGAGA
jgi:uncharacterized peroxidase-related enzyme